MFSCLQCGRCCRRAGIVFLTRGEMERITTALGLTFEEGVRRYGIVEEGRLTLKDGSRGECIFYDWDTARCRIYPVRPDQCRVYPFWPSILESPEKWEEEGKMCPGIRSVQRPVPDFTPRIQGEKVEKKPRKK
ncbi:MAG: YkgJ family cysteine cluster protein [Synergistaceae bacterium]|nr:YkgJ family cysteine cluster protein [Synergistaceae bacterium]